MIQALPYPVKASTISTGYTSKWTQIQSNLNHNKEKEFALTIIEEWLTAQGTSQSFLLVTYFPSAKRRKKNKVLVSDKK